MFYFYFSIRAVYKWHMLHRTRKDMNIFTRRSDRPPTLRTFLSLWRYRRLISRILESKKFNAALATFFCSVILPYRWVFSFIVRIFSSIALFFSVVLAASISLLLPLSCVRWFTGFFCPAVSSTVVLSVDSSSLSSPWHHRLPLSPEIIDPRSAVLMAFDISTGLRRWSSAIKQQKHKRNIL